jgi:hypothetical protein
MATCLLPMRLTMLSLLVVAGLMSTTMHETIAQGNIHKTNNHACCMSPVTYLLFLVNGHLPAAHEAD